MKFLARAIAYAVVNAIALLAAAYLVQGFTVARDLAGLAIAAVILTVINLLLRPLLKLVFGPLILLTFGLFTIVVNAILLYILDALSTAVTIEGYVPLLIGALVVSAVNLILGFGAKRISS